MSLDEYYKELNSFESLKKPDPKCCDYSFNYIPSNGVINCKICNNLIDNIIDSPEWRYYGSTDTKNDNPTRCGMPVNVLLPDSSVGTSINNRGKGQRNNKVLLYQQWNSMPYKERSKYKVFTEIKTNCDLAGLPNVISNTANSLYSIISDTKISRGNNRKGIIAACVFNACKECSVPRSIKEISEIFNLNPKILTKACKNYTDTLRINKINISRIQNTRSIDLNDFIERFCNNINHIDLNINKIIKIANLCIKHKLIYDNTPPAMAAGCIYLYIKLMNIDINKKNISINCKISEVTINKCYKKLETNPSLMDEIKKNVI